MHVQRGQFSSFFLPFLVKSGLFGVNPDHFRTNFFKKSPDPDQSPEKTDQMGALVTGGGSSVVYVATLLPSQYKTKLNNRHQPWLNLSLIPAVI